jgi:glycosyltransferase involved in cell wall biosynthesis
MWPEVLLEVPEATLNVFCPGYSQPDVKEWPKGVTYHGTVSQEVLHEWQSKSEYWLHPTEYEETYCITALEMQYAKVVPITTNVAALKEVVSNRGYLLDPNETNQAFIDIIKDLKRSKELRDIFTDKAYKWAREQSWNLRILDWIKLLKEYED